MSFYVASKVYHYPMWQKLREEGAPISASWIDLVEGERERSDEEWGDISQMCLREAAAADVLLLYAEMGDVLRGAYMEMGAALAAGNMVGVVVPSEFEVTEILLPHPSVSRFKCLKDAVVYYNRCFRLDECDE